MKPLTQFILIFFVSVTGGLLWFHMASHKNAFHFVCQMVEERYYETSPELKSWSQACRKQAGDPFFAWFFKSYLIQSIRGQLYRLGVSHLDIYTPREKRQMWQGQEERNGLIIKNLNQRFWVKDFIPESPAATRSIKRGDEILTINGKPPVSSWEVEHSSGHFRFRREESIRSVKLNKKILQLDQKPRLERVSDKIGFLKLPSFRGEYFKKSAWKQLVSKTLNYDNLILDVRGNPGGNFVSLLRALSAFLCRPQKVGYLIQPRLKNTKETALPDDINDGHQVNLLENHGRIHLSTFKGYPCFRGGMVVLVDNGTASVSEIFAHVLRDRKKTRIMGKATKGSVILAVWYKIPDLGAGYSLSIPEALYKDLTGQSLEGGGVYPDKVVTYKKADLAKGVDSLEVAAKNWLNQRQL